MFASVKWCAEPIAQHADSQGHSSRSWVWALNFVSALYLLSPGIIFSKIWSNVYLGWKCAEPITQPCGLKVRITVESHEFEPWVFCRLHISFTPGRIFFKRWSNVCLSEIMCRTHNSAMLTRSRSKLKVTSLSLEFWGRSIAIQTALLNLGQLFALARWCIEPITQRCRLKVKVTNEGHTSLSCSLHISWTIWKIFMKLWSNVCLSKAVQNP